MSAYREPAGADDVPHCLGLAYAGTRALDAREIELVAARVAGRTWQMVALALGVPGGSLAALMAASRMGAASVTIAAGAVSFVCTVTAWTLAIERFFVLLRLRRDLRRAEVLRFEGVLPDVPTDALARRLAAMARETESVETSIELLPGSGLVWRMHDVLVEVPLQMRASRNIPARRT